jgi:hypothetical protein
MIAISTSPSLFTEVKRSTCTNQAGKRNMRSGKIPSRPTLKHSDILYLTAFRVDNIETPSARCPEDVAHLIDDNFS